MYPAAADLLRSLEKIVLVIYLTNVRETVPLCDIARDKAQWIPRLSLLGDGPENADFYSLQL